MKIFGAIIGGILALALVVWGLGFLLGWGKTAVDVVSPANVKAQHEVVITKYNGMISSAKNACTVQKAGVDSEEKSATLIEDPMLAYSATFNNVVADYNSAVDNAFRAGIVAPAGYPESVDINYIDTDDWCTVPDQILDLRN